MRLRKYDERRGNEGLRMRALLGDASRCAQSRATLLAYRMSVADRRVYQYRKQARVYLKMLLIIY